MADVQRMDVYVLELLKQPEIFVIMKKKLKEFFNSRLRGTLIKLPTQIPMAKGPVKFKFIQTSELSTFSIVHIIPKQNLYTNFYLKLISIKCFF